MNDAEGQQVPSSRRRSAWAAAVLAALAATLARMALTPFLGEFAVPFLTYFPAILFIAWYGGFGPSLLCILLSALVASYYFLPPSNAFFVTAPGDQLTLAMFLLVAAGIAWLGDSQRRAVQKAIQEAERRRRAEIAQREQREWFETTLESIGDAVIATDAEARVRFMNSVAAYLTGWDLTEAMMRPLDDVFRIVNEDTGATGENPVPRVLRDGVTAGLANHTLLISKDGRRIPIDDSAAPILQNNGVIGAVLVFRDITERRKAERAMASLAALVESSEDAIVAKSLEGVILSWNPGAERLYGYQAEEIVGKPIRLLVPPEKEGEESEILARLRQGKRVDHFETVRVRRDGEMVDVSLTISPIRDKTGEVVGASHVARDVTEQKQYTQKLQETQRLESLGVLAGGIAHDFNNLLVGVLGSASLALDYVDQTSPARVLIDGVVTSAEKAAELTRQMLAYAGKGQLALQPVNLAALVEETLPLIHAAIPSTVSVQLDISSDLPLVEADPSQIRQLVMNLVINGAEAIPEGKPGQVAIRTRPHSAPSAGERATDGTGGQPDVLLEVRDSGVGMDEAVKARIFEPFFTTKFLGRGLGMAAVRGIIRRHRGSIEIESVPGAGTTVRALLPALAAREHKSVPEIADEPDRLGSATVLVVDDELVVRKTVQRALERYGYKVLVAENGKAGIEILLREQDRIDCVLLDMTMPVMSGEETFAKLKEIRPEVPVILSSGFSESEAARRFDYGNLAGFVQKPYRPDALAAKLAQILRVPPSDRESSAPE